MFDKVTVVLSPGHQYFAYVDGDHIEIEALIDGHPVHLGSAQWDGQTLANCTRPLRREAFAALTRAIAARRSQPPTI